MGAQGFWQYSKLVWKHTINQYKLWVSAHLLMNVVLMISSAIGWFFISPESRLIAFGTVGNAILSGFLGILFVAIPVFLIFLIIASSQLYQIKQQEINQAHLTIAELHSKRDALRANYPDMPLGEAIEHIKLTRVKYKSSDGDSNLKDICQLARLRRITLWGKKSPSPELEDCEEMSDTFSEIPSELLEYYTGFPHDIFGFCLGLSARSRYDICDGGEGITYLHVTVNRAHIDVHFE